MILEFLVLLGFAAIGSLVLGTADRRMLVTTRAASAFLAGTGVVISATLALVVTGSPTHPLLALVLASLAAVGVAVRRGVQATLDARALTVVAVAVAVAVVLFRSVHVVGFHWDSFRYLASSELLARGLFVSDGDVFLFETRLLAVPGVHSFAALHDELYLRAFAPLLGLATLTLLGWFAFTGTVHRLRPTVAGWLAVIAIVTLLSVNRFVYNSVYVNGHLLVAAALLVVAAVTWIARERPDLASLPTLYGLQLIMLPMLVVARPETSFLAMLAIAPAMTSVDVPIHQRRALLLVTGGVVAVWHGWLWWRYSVDGVKLATTVPLMTALGVAVAASSRLVGWRRLTADRPSLLLPAELLLWSLLAVFAVREPSILRNSVAATVRNAALGEQSWGLSLVLLGLLAMVVWVGGRDVSGILLRFPLTTFVPLVMISAYLRDSPYRVNPADSLNRMLIHVVPLLVLYIAAGASGTWSVPGAQLLRSGRGREMRARDDAGVNRV